MKGGRRSPGESAGHPIRRSEIDTLVKGWEMRGALRSGLAAGEAAERLWLLTTVESFLTATDRLDWPPERYESWMGEVTERELLGKPTEEAPTE